MTQCVGITAAGNWIVDRVKQVDCLPGRGTLFARGCCMGSMRAGMRWRPLGWGVAVRPPVCRVRGASEGVQPLEATLKLAQRFGERKPPVPV